MDSTLFIAVEPHEKNFWTIIEFYEDKADEFMTAQTNHGLTSATTMRLVDMYFWQVGYDNSPKQTKIITTS